MSAHLLEPLAQYISQQPNAPALVVDNQIYYYKELGHSLQQIATWCRRVTPKRNPRIGILASRNITAYASLLGVIWASGAYLPLNVHLPTNYLTNIISEADLDGLIVDSAGIAVLDAIGRPDIPIFAPFVTLSSKNTQIDDASLQHSLPLMNSPAPCRDDDIAYQMFTSGTTGSPKGIPVSVSNLRYFINSCLDRYKLTPEDRVSQAHMLTFDLSILDIFLSVLSGASLHVIPNDQLNSPAHFIRTNKLSIWISVPSVTGMLSQMNLLKPGAFPDLRWVIFCGEALPVNTVTAIRQAAPFSLIDNLYGPTEVTVACLCQECTQPSMITQDRGIVAIGRPFPNHHAAIVDDYGNFLSADEPGELAISGPQVTSGYWLNPQLSALRYPDLVHPELGKIRWYLTGDLARRDNTGCYHFLGRIDNQIKLRGYRIELDEIEYHLRRISECDNAVVILIERDNSWTNEIIGVISSDQKETESLRHQLLELLPPYKVPKRIVSITSLPRNSSGKIDRLALKHQLRSLNIL